MSTKDLMKVVICNPPLKDPEIAFIDNTYETAQSIVNGYPERVRVIPDLRVWLVCDEEFLLKADGMEKIEPNRIIMGYPYYGPIYFVGFTSEGDYRGLTAEEVKVILELCRLSKIETLMGMIGL